MPKLPLKSFSYEDYKHPRALVDKLTENFNLIWWLLQGNLGTDNLADTINNTTNIFGEVNPATDIYGIDPTFLKYHPNKVSNSSFERIRANGTPYYWDTASQCSPNSNFDDTYSLALLPVGTAVQQNEGDPGSGLWDTTWWTWAPSSRISFRAKAENNPVLKVEVLNAAGTAQLLKRWTFTANQKPEPWVEIEGVTYFEFTITSQWPTALYIIAVTPTVAGPMKIKFTNKDGADNIYIDAVTAEPDYSGRWPSFYTHGPNSVRQIFDGVAEPTGGIDGDIWLPDP